MPFKFSYKSKKRFTKKKSDTKKPKTSTLKKVVKKVNFLDKIDNCYRGGQLVDAVIPSIVGAPDTQTMSTIATGLVLEPTNIDRATGSNNVRLRNQIKLKNLHMRYQLRVSALSNISDLITRVGYKVRIMVVYQKMVGNNQSNTTTVNSYPSIGQLLYVNNICTSADILAHQTWVNKTNLRILYDKVHLLDPIYRGLDAGVGTVPLGTGKRQDYGVANINLSKLPPIKYMGADGDTQVASGRVCVYMFSDNINANTNPILMDVDYILNYDN